MALVITPARASQAQDSDRIGLPRTRTFRRQRPLRLWWIAIAIAITANLGVVLGLSQISRLHQTGSEPPLAVRTLRQADPDEPPPPPEPTHEQNESTPEDVVAVALPTLDLASSAPVGALALPAVGCSDADLALPLSMPAFTTIGAGDGPPVIGNANGPAAYDVAAERESTLDLDRYYPRAARLRGVEGTTRVRLSIDATGRVAEVQILTSTPPGVFDEASLRVGHAIRYRPAQAAGKPVASVQETTIAWTIRK